jgi:error-prone DNA polymerase
MLASIGALNRISPEARLHRRDALWQVAKAGWRVGPLLRQVVEADVSSPLSTMDTEERLIADYHGTGLTVGPHPMAYRRMEMRRLGIRSAAELQQMPHGRPATVGGCVITRQRPGTAKGLIFMTLEDETGNSNVIISRDFFEKNRVNVLYERFVQISGTVQNQDGIVHLKAEAIAPLAISTAEIQSHDFH